MENPTMPKNNASTYKLFFFYTGKPTAIKFTLKIQTKSNKIIYVIFRTKVLTILTTHSSHLFGV